MEKRVEVCQDYLWKKIKKKRPGWKNKRTRNNKCQCIYGYGSEQCNRTTTFHFVLSFLRLSDLSSLACALKQLCTLFIVRKVFLEEKEAILKDFPSSLRVSTKFDAWNRGDETIREEHDEEINKTYESTRKNATRDRALNGSRWFLDHFQRFSKLSMTFLFSLSLPLFSLSRDVFLSIYDQRPELRYEGNYSSRYLDRRFWRERERERERSSKRRRRLSCSSYGERELFDLKQLILHVLPLIPPLQLETCFWEKRDRFFERIRFKRDTLGYVHRS